MKKLVNKFRRFVGRGTGILILLLLWEITPRLGWVDQTFLSPPSVVAQAFYDLVMSGQLRVHFLSSIKRSLLGLFLAVVVGTSFGIFIGWFKRLEYFADPVFQSFRQMSAFALFPVFVLFFGIGEVSKVIIIFWASLWPVLLNTINGVKNVDKLLIDSAKSLGASQTFIFLKIVLPAATPGIITGIRLGGSYSVLALVAAEMIGAESGLGFLILYSQETFKIPDMFAAIIALTFVGLTFNYTLSFIEGRLTKWKGRSAENF